MDTHTQTHPYHGSSSLSIVTMRKPQGPLVTSGMYVVSCLCVICLKRAPAGDETKEETGPCGPVIDWPCFSVSV